MTIRIIIDPDNDDIQVEDHSSEDITPLSDRIAFELGKLAQDILKLHNTKGTVYTTVVSS